MQSWERVKDAIESNLPLPPTWKATALLRGFGLLKVPLLFSLRPRVVRIDDEACWIRVPLNRWTKNHLGSLYFGALAMGADAVVGLMALHHCRKRKAHSVHLSFKDFQANFLRRPEGPVIFACDAGELVEGFVEKVIASGQRENCTIPAYAFLEGQPSEVVAEFKLTLSLKRK
jgi:acyl-coenzyme A thioesterase PaaI-like protein